MSRESLISSGVRINSIGMYIPPDRLSNLERMAEFSINLDFLQQKLGVIERSVKGKDEATSDLCVRAFEDLGGEATVALSEVQLLCVVTQNPDYKIPYTAAVLHQKLGLGRGCMTFDISQGCAGYTHAIAIVSALMKDLGLENALLFTCDPYSNIVERGDKNTSMLFGDAASVSYLSRHGKGYVLTDSDFGTVPNSYACLRCTSSLEMDGRAVFLNAVREIPKSIQHLLSRNGLSLEEVDLLLLHQGSKYLVDYLKQVMHLPNSKVPFEIAEYGNTVSSSIPIMLKKHLSQGTYPRIILSGFGVGFSWGSCLMELTS